MKKTFELGVQYVTLFLFSTENWSRPENEVSNILNLLNKYLSDFSSYLKQEKIQLRVIGQKNRLPEYTQYLLDTVGYNLRSSTNKDNNISVGNEGTLRIISQYFILLYPIQYIHIHDCM